jgi:hypothetical protein
VVSTVSTFKVGTRSRHSRVDDGAALISHLQQHGADSLRQQPLSRRVSLIHGLDFQASQFFRLRGIGGEVIDGGGPFRAILNLQFLAEMQEFILELGQSRQDQFLQLSIFLPGGLGIEIAQVVLFHIHCGSVIIMESLFFTFRAMAHIFEFFPLPA